MEKDISYLKNTFEKHSISQLQLADLLSISQSAVSQFLNGQAVSKDKIKKMQTFAKGLTHGR